MSVAGELTGTASASGRRRGRTLLAAVASRPAFWLTGLVGLSFVVRAATVARVPSAWILPDEIVYSELAKSIADGGRPSIRGVPVFGWGEVYPVLTAPAWALFDDAFQAYHAVLAINSLVISLAAIPAYALGRLFVGRGLAFLVAVLTVLVPSMAYSGVVMTENACYPVFIVALLAVTRCVRTPSLANQLGALVGLALLAMTRIQGAALAGALVVALVCYPMLGPASERRPYLRRAAPTLVVLLLVPLAPVFLSLARGDGAFGWAGARSGTFAELHPGEAPAWFTYLLADLVLYVGVVPAAATAIVVGMGLARRNDERERLLAATVLPAFAAMLGSVALVSAALDVDGTENLNERYVFYVVPLLFVGLALWIEKGLHRPRPWSWLVVGAACILAFALPVDRLEYNASFQSLALMPWIFVPLSGIALQALVALFTLACGLVWLTCSRARVGRLVLLSVAVMVFAGVLAVGSYRVSAANSSSPFRGLPATWIDDALPGGDPVAVVWREPPLVDAAPRQLYFWVMVTEFFNERVGSVYRFGPRTYHESFLPTVPVVRGPSGAIVERSSGVRINARYALVPCQTRVEGRVVATAPGGYLELIEVDPPLRLASRRPCQWPSW